MTRTKLVDLMQPPNLPIIVAVSASALSLWLYPTPYIGMLCITIATGAWFTWAWLEIFQGQNYVRRIMGGVVMLILLSLITVSATMILGSKY